jgi:hypothetical protein
VAPNFATEAQQLADDLASLTKRIDSTPHAHKWPDDDLGVLGNLLHHCRQLASALEAAIDEAEEARDSNG